MIGLAGLVGSGIPAVSRTNLAPHEHEPLFDGVRTRIGGADADPQRIAQHGLHQLLDLGYCSQYHDL